MADYRKMYYKIFNAATYANNKLMDAAAVLQEAQRECEEMYGETDDTPLFLRETNEHAKDYPGERPPYKA